MRITWFHHQHADKLLVFFSGWGVDVHPFSHLSAYEYDVLFVDRYLDLDCEELPSILSAYDYVTIVGWSMGVSVALTMVEKLNIRPNRLIAINGTMEPIHPTLGIDPQWFQATIHQFDQLVLDKFYRRMCGNKKDLERFKQNLPQRSMSTLKAELIFLYQQYHSNVYKEKKDIFDSVLISSRDMIFTAKNQTNAWGAVGCHCVSTRSAHFCFYEKHTWDDLIEMVDA